MSHKRVAAAAVVWDAQGEARILSELLATDYGLDLQGMNLESAVGISEDGSTIVGYTWVGATIHGWVVTIPEPSSLLLLLCGCASLCRFNRASRERT
ncbi:MAG TPA: hypothetical protein PL151_06775 [Phycisphaerae bacterium]|nr:hypothetical protein [Phycisphaerae bacterium]HOJ76080.1 hypothetical protein [Phycisphaerae bacterium]HOM53425.1 hypothetical protein [Phycisphaerae bacterium]HPU28090.1 hypothetical protein [Phycisphaerae bacterium]HPZ99657.1 hypothetical protein [Phycisphaerae bacterium]